jgi:hypothetical protein
MKIYDCFTFYNELDLLELRLQELYDHVDHFVIVESNTTFTNKPKSFYFEENRQRFAAWADKIIHVPVANMPGSEDAWTNETFQRDQILQGIKDAADDDLIIVSDVDEILRPAALDFMRNSDATLFALRMTLHNFKFNYVRASEGKYSVWGMACHKHLFDDITPDMFRQLRFNFEQAPYQFRQGDMQVVEHAGWHFGYLGNKDYLRDKAQSFSHKEVNTPEFLAQIDPETSIAQRTDWGHNNVDKYVIVALDQYFPQTIRDNTDKYAQWILNDIDGKILDMLPPYTYNS